MAKNGNGNGNGNGRTGRPATDEERAWLWARWQVLQSETQLAKEKHPDSGRSFHRSTIHRLREADDWDGRLDDIRRRAQQLADDKSSADLAQLAEIGRAIANATAKKLLSDGTDGQQVGELKGKATVSDFVATAKLLKDLVGEQSVRIELHVTTALEQQAQVYVEVTNNAMEFINDPAEREKVRETILAGVMGALGRLRTQSWSE